MRFETVDALVLLVSTYTTSIEATGAVIPPETVELIGTNPFKACEALNELAVTCRALTPETDAGLAAIYESMDAADARSEASPEACEQCVAAFNRVHVEPPEPEPEPEIQLPAEEYYDEYEPEVDAGFVEIAAEPEATEEPEAEPAPEGEPASEPEPEAKPTPEKPANKGQAFEGEVFSVDQALAILGISRPTLTKMIESGQLPAYKKGRSWQISATAVLDIASNK